MSKDKGERETEVLSTLLFKLLQHDRHIFNYNSTGSSYKLRQLINFVIPCHKLSFWLHTCSSCYLTIAEVPNENIKGKERRWRQMSSYLKHCLGPPSLHCSGLRIRRGQISKWVWFASNFFLCLFVHFSCSNTEWLSSNKKVIFFKDDIVTVYEKNGSIFALLWNW